MPRTALLISADLLGRNEQAVIRALLDAFRDRGWRDASGAALSLTRSLHAHPAGLTSTRLARSVPDGFLLQNSVSRAQVGKVLEDLVN